MNQIKVYVNKVLVPVLFILMSQLADDCYAKASHACDSFTHAQQFSEKSGTAVSDFHKSDKTKDSLEILRIRYYSIGTQDKKKIVRNCVCYVLFKNDMQ